MNFNVWNIKEMLSIPSGSIATKSSSWNNNQTDYSSLSDSQFLFGSQFCPENSESLSAPLDFGIHLRQPKLSQQNSLDSEPSIFTKYQTKPQLFGGDAKDAGLCPLPSSVGKSKGLLEQFEEKKQRAKDKCDSESLYNFISHVRESINRLQTSVEKSEEYLSSRSQSILDSLETVAKTVRETVQAQNDLVLETMQDKSKVEQALLEMQKRFEARQAEFIEMKSDLKHLEVLVAQQNKDFQQLCEQLGQLKVPTILAELKKLISFPGVLKNVQDSSSQTSSPLAQSLSFTRQEKYASEEAVMWQGQGPPAAKNLSMGSPCPGKYSVWSEGTKSDALQEEAVLLAAGTTSRNRQVKDKAVQTNCKNWAITKISSQNPGSGFVGHKVPADGDLVFQGASKLLSLNFATSIQNTCQKYHTKGMFSCDPCEQTRVTEQKCRTVGRVGRGKKQQHRKAHRGRLIARKQEQTPSNTSVFNSKYPQLPVYGPKRPPQKQQEPFIEPLQLQDPRSPIKSISPALGGTVLPSKTATAMEGGLLLFNRFSSQDNSSQEDHQISWFSDLNLRSSEPPLGKERGKNLLYDLGFDSSDDGF
ncbi:PREDICTED: coiled-coil domain-containing protein 36 [Condylura cristata]|uniref:coiled-coil domain-containing protein 36 n=1 Tax=Condylura cristata TaxID=143302 RepID=UPI0003343633|nr:PREDICTED: coiled-coil domain-containing protein 36 [Condylura cristata]